MEEKPNLDNVSENLQLYFILLQPYIHGNPGNATVMAKLMTIHSNVYMEGAEKGFRKKHSEYENEPGWLWIIYKDICKKDIEKTNEYLKELCKN